MVHRDEGGNISTMALITDTMPVGLIIRKQPGVTRWVKWIWQPVGLIPGAGETEWRELRRDGDTVEYHAATLNLTIYSSDTDAYRATLNSRTPSLYVVMSDAADPVNGCPWTPKLITVNAFEGQGYNESGEGLVELVPMPVPMIAWLRDFIEKHHVEEEFIKRRRDKKRIDLVEDGKGDIRIRQTSDVFRAPRNSSGRVN